MALFFIAMIIMGAVYLSLVFKTMKLLDASRKEIELLTRKAQENIKITWGRWDMVSPTEGYPKLIINNTGSVPVHVVQVVLEIREKQGNKWPVIVQGPWIIARKIDLPVGNSITIKANQKLNRKLIENWYKNNMIRILEARILTSTGNVFITIYNPKPPRSNLKPGMNTMLFYWSAADWMDVENNAWWHGDRIGYYKMTPPDGAWSIDGGNIEIPAWETTSTKTISFKFMVYLPGTDSDGYVLNSKNFLVLAVEFIDKGTGPSHPPVVYYTWSLTIENLVGDKIYSVSTGEIADAITDPDGVPRTACFKLDPSNSKFIVFDGIHVVRSLGKVPKKLEPGWYIIELKIRLRAGTAGSATLGLKSVFLYISNKNLW